jgi:hypothetical protein
MQKGTRVEGGVIHRPDQNGAGPNRILPRQFREIGAEPAMTKHISLGLLLEREKASTIRHQDMDVCRFAQTLLQICN